MEAVAEPRHVERFDAVTEDPGEIHELTRAMFGASGRIERSDGRAPSLRLAQAAVAELGVQRVTWNVDGRCDAAPLERFVCIRLRSGGYGLDQGRGDVQYVPGDAFLVDPWRQVHVEVIGADFDSFTVEQSVLEQVSRQIAPGSAGRVDFQQALPLSPRLARTWDGVLSETSRALSDDDLVAENALIRAGLLFRLAATACAVYGLTRESRAERPAPPRAVRRATAYIDEHLAEAITVGDIAEVAGLSARGLHAAFRRELDTTPLAYLRRARLHAVREELVHATEETTVGAVAVRWGFQHLGRFADRYRREFGDLPSNTLRP